MSAPGAAGNELRDTQQESESGVFMNMIASGELKRQRQVRGRIQALLIIAIVVLPIVAAYIMFYTRMGIPQHTTNKGDLLNPPVAVATLNLHTLAGEPWDVNAQEKKWRLLIPGGRDCGMTCVDNLFLTRQVHIRLAEKSARLERIYLLQDNDLSAATAEYLQRDHPHVPVLKIAPDAFAELQKSLPHLATSSLSKHYFLMDQEGFVMMAYSPENSGKDLLTDIKRMLKYSPEE